MVIAGQRRSRARHGRHQHGRRHETVRVPKRVKQVNCPRPAMRIRELPRTEREIQWLTRSLVSPEFISRIISRPHRQFRNSLPNIHAPTIVEYVVERPDARERLPSARNVGGEVRDVSRKRERTILQCLWKAKAVHRECFLQALEMFRQARSFGASAPEISHRPEPLEPIRPPSHRERIPLAQFGRRGNPEQVPPVCVTRHVRRVAHTGEIGLHRRIPIPCKEQVPRDGEVKQAARCGLCPEQPHLDGHCGDRRAPPRARPPPRQTSAAAADEGDRARRNAATRAEKTGRRIVWRTGAKAPAPVPRARMLNRASAHATAPAPHQQRCRPVRAATGPREASTRRHLPQAGSLPAHTSPTPTWAGP